MTGGVDHSLVDVGAAVNEDIKHTDARHCIEKNEYKSRASWKESSNDWTSASRSTWRMP